MDDDHALPTDLAECQQLLLSAFRQATELSRVLDETSASYEALQATYQAVLDELSALKRWIYGRRTEKLIEGEGQRHLFDLAASSTTAQPVEPTPELPRPTAAGRRRRRELDLDKLPYVRHEHDLSEADKQCSGCGRAKDRIGQDESRILEYVPAKLEVHVYVRPKYACRYCKDHVTSPPPPPRPIARGIAGPGLIAQIVVGKFGDHLPLYRQEDFFTRHGLHIPRSTLCDWVQAAAELLKPLYQRQKELVIQSPVLWTDDTPVTLLSSGGPEGSRQGRFWTYIAAQHPYSVYDFTESRSRDGPASFLRNFQGYLHADAYSGYDHIYLGSNEAIIEVACWAHARRKFFDAIHSSPREVHQLLEWIRQLYDIEERARELSADARCAMRAAEATPVLDRLVARLAELEKRALPKSVLSKAVWYARNQWQALCRYTEDGRLSIDNNVSERTLRHQAIGRKNWLFLGSKQAGPRAAILFTILAGAKRHHIEPWTYLRELLLRLHDDDPRLDEMLPDQWAANHPEAVLTYRLEESRRKAATCSTRRRHARATSPTA
jgi:transposase